MGNAFHGQKYEWPTCNIVQYILCPVIVHCGTTPILTPITPDLIVLQIGGTEMVMIILNTIDLLTPSKILSPSTVHLKQCHCPK